MTKSIFKNTLLILMGLVVLSFSSCEKDSDDDKKADYIIGVWTITSSSFEATINDVDIIQYFMTAFGVTQAQAELFTEDFYEDVTGTANFKSDGTYTMTQNGIPESGTYMMNADNSKITMDKGTADEMTLDIVTLTSSKLELSFTETDMEDMDEDGTIDTLKITVSLVLTK